MNKKATQLILIIFIASFAIPNLVFASWWNPFSWSWFSKSVKMQPAQVITAVETLTTETVGIQATTTANTEAKESTNVQETNSVPLRPTTDIPVVVKPKILPCDQDCMNRRELSKRQEEEAKKQNAIILENQRMGLADVAEKAEQDRLEKETRAKDPRTIAIKEFLDNPTIDSFRIFCDKAKTLQGWNTTSGLDASREHLVSTTNSLYEDVQCKILNQTNITIYTLPDSNFSVPLQTNDSDNLRTIKIIRNQQLADLSARNKFLIYTYTDNDSYRAIEGLDPHSFISVLQYLLQRAESPSLSNFLPPQSLSNHMKSLFSPVDLLNSKRGSLNY